MSANELTKTLRWLAKETEFVFAKAKGMPIKFVGGGD